MGPGGFNGVHVFAPDGTLIGKVHLPETCSNLCFGGAKKDRLFMAASQSPYAVYVNTEGAETPWDRKHDRSGQDCQSATDPHFPFLATQT